MVEYLSLRF